MHEPHALHAQGTSCNANQGMRPKQEPYMFRAGRGLLELLGMAWNEASVHNALLEVINVEDHGVVLNGGGHTADDQLIQSTAHAVDGSWPVLGPHNELAQQ